MCPQSFWLKRGAYQLCLVFCGGVMESSDRPPVPKAVDPAWLRNSGARADEFARQARLQALPPVPPPPADAVGDVGRRRLLVETGVGLNYQAVAAKVVSICVSCSDLGFYACSTGKLFSAAPRVLRAGPSLRGAQWKIIDFLCLLTLHTRAHRREAIINSNTHPV